MRYLVAPLKPDSGPTRVTVPGVRAMKASCGKVATVTADDATVAQMLEEGGADTLLVGNSLGMGALEDQLGYWSHQTVSLCGMADRVEVLLKREEDRVVERILARKPVGAAVWRVASTVGPAASPWMRDSRGAKHSAQRARESARADVFDAELVTTLQRLPEGTR